MPLQSDILRIAEAEIESFECETDLVVNEHYRAQDCCHCEDLLRNGIEACLFLTTFDKSLIKADRMGQIRYDHALRQAIKLLFIRWLKQSEKTFVWIAKVKNNGYEIENLQQFKNCCETVQDWLETHDWCEMSEQNMQANIEWDENS